MLDLFFSTPIWIWGVGLVLFLTGVACLGLFLFHRSVHLELRRTHNELAGFNIAVVGVIYAVLLAFIAIATWESFSKTEELVEAESDYAGAIYLDTQGLPSDMGRNVRSASQAYVKTVIEQEWPTMESGKPPGQGWKPLRDLNAAITAIRPQDAGQTVVLAELLKTWSQLYQTRSARLSAAEGDIPNVLWWVIFLGAAVTIGYTYLFGFHNFSMHLVMTAGVTVSIAIVIVLIIDLSQPFRGELRISPAPFVMTQQSWEGMALTDHPR